MALGTQYHNKIRLRKIPLIFWLTIFKNGLGEEKYKERGLPEPVGIRGDKKIKCKKIKDL